MIAMLRRLLHVFRGSDHDADLREEMETHRALRQAALERDGLRPVDAAAASRRAMGNVTLAVEDARDVWALRVLDTVRQDLRTALRGLRKSPGFTAVAVGTLALGIGANTALFSIFNSLIMRPLPVRDPASLALLTDGSWSYPVWREIDARGTRLFDGAFAWSGQGFDLSAGGRADTADGAYVSGRFFEVLGVPAFRGRMLSPADDSASPPDGPVAVISHRFWQQRFDGAADVVGRQLTVQRRPFTIVGVMPPGFTGVDVGRMADVMLPFSAEPILQGRETRLESGGSWWMEFMVRLKPGQTIAQANGALQAVQPQVREATFPFVGTNDAAYKARYLKDPFVLAPAASGNSPLRRQYETPLTAMVIAVGLVLLVACANIASLMLARALGRRQELSVRLALGGSRLRLARLLLIESVLVALAGAGLGLLFARWSSALLVQQLNTWRGTVSLDLAVDWRVLAFTAVLACLCAIGAGVAPAIGLRSVAPGEAVKDAGRTLMGDRRFAVRGALVVGQIAISFVLVIAAGLFLRSFASLHRLPLGFEPRPLVVVSVNLLASGFLPEERGLRLERLRDAASVVPGVRAAALSSTPRLTGGGWATGRVGFGDGPLSPEDRTNRIWRDATSPGWFGAMRIPLRGGRDFAAGDRMGSPPVAIVNEAFVRRFLPGRSPVGQMVRMSTADGPKHEIVGVVADAVYTTPREGMMPTLYTPLAQRDAKGWESRREAMLTIEAEPGQRAVVERAVAAALTRADPAAVFTSNTFDQMVDATVTRERLVALLSGFFGALAVLLAGLGLYGVVAHAVRARRTEFGLRIALGARPFGITSLVFRRVGVLVVLGLAIGLAAGLWLSRFVAPLLFQVEARDPAMFAGAAVVLMAVGVLAAWAPARRAARFDPATLLRDA